MDENSFLKCIVDPNRRGILRALGPDERCVSDIIAATGLEQTLVSFHLKSLRMCGLVSSRRNGKNKLYKVSDPAIIGVLKNITEISKKISCSCGDNDACQ